MIFQELPEELTDTIFDFLGWKCHQCKVKIHKNNVYKKLTKCNTVHMYCSKECYNFF